MFNTKNSWVLAQEALNSLNFPSPELWYFLALGKTPQKLCLAARAVGPSLCVSHLSCSYTLSLELIH